ncbi:MAG: hypothetical protein AMXMBFR64_61560 [Myxococcales bacterium]
MPSRRGLGRELGEALLRADQALDSASARIALSALILASLMPLGIIEELRTGFLLVFTLEITLRLGIFAARGRLRGERNLSEALFIALDMVATLSFLPVDTLEMLGVDTSVLRLVRAARMLLLLAYWGPTFRDFFQIALRRERLYQFGVIIVFALMLTATGAAALRLFDLRHLDTDGNGVPGEPTDWELPNVLWWAFRQVQDPGNLSPDTHDAGVLAVSLALTAGGMLLVAFLIGIGANLVEEVFRAGRYRPLALRDHTVILNAEAGSLGVLVEISSYHRKQLSKPRMVVVGEASERPDFLNEPHVRRFRYLPGRPTDLQTLARAAVRDARRVVLLADGTGQEADAATVTTTLAVLDAGGSAQVAAEMNHPHNADLLLRTGRRTIPVLARRLASLALGQATVSPGVEALLDELLSSEGSEIYTCVTGEGLCRELPRTLQMTDGLLPHIAATHAASQVVLIGVLVEHERGGVASMVPQINPGRPSRPSGQDVPKTRGLIGVADRFRSLRQLVEACHTSGLPVASLGGATQPLARVRTADHPRRVLVLGFHEDAVEVVDQLVRLCPAGLEIRILVGTPHKRELTVEALREQLGAPDLSLVVGPGELRVVRPGGVSRVLVEARDRLTPGLYRNALLDAERPDAILILRRDRAELDPDAATVLGVLRLMEASHDLTPEAAQALPHVVAELYDADKLTLLKAQTAGHPLGTRLSLICTERLRQRVLAQSFFVPGLSALYRELLRAGGQEILTLDPLGTPTFGALMRNLPATLGAIPVAVATADPEAPFGLRVHVNPPADFGQEERILRVYAVGPHTLREEALGQSA